MKKYPGAQSAVPAGPGRAAADCVQAPDAPDAHYGCGWLLPDWPAAPGVHALCTTRSGGVSLAPYDSLNLGAHVGDAAAAVRANRRRLQAVLRARTPAARALFLRQVHGSGVALLHAGARSGMRADACISSASGLVCTVLVADCLPVLLAQRSGAVVGAAHAGWRGLAGRGGNGVLEAVFAHFCAQVQNLSAHRAIQTEAPGGLTRAAIARDTLAWLGPCIGAQAFEVGPEVRAAFCTGAHAAAACFGTRGAGPGKYLCDLAGLARLRLRALGITEVYGNDGSARWCTLGNPSDFFSHRRDAAALGASGRMAACIWRA